ncbi:DUF7351 domain-containing protein [Halolamina salifodinae]|uniref:Helix-turn-helix domain-containing protein n=1 Tax=Halolamina salifodinae TaxID=1202767 RepID=A0A8T4GZJ5_9EURY|nr:winged helix-turn-helix domain-containing protein [Halolamina salifodinae]MBP1988396.1 hypothetical protein [Halolamina salifodinae]
MGETSSVDVFELLGQETRVEILRALLAARRDGPDPFLSFTELKDAAGVRDTGRFNYHLNQLLGTLVVDTEDGYRLSSFGFRLFARLSAGLSDPDPDIEPVPLPGHCPECDAELAAAAGGNQFQLVCGEGHTLNEGLLGSPRAVANRSPEAAAETLALVNTQATELGVSGVCPSCHGRTEGGIEHVEGYGYRYRAPCSDCGNQFATTVGDCVATHPEVVSFLAERGIDARREATWTLPFRLPDTETVVSEDPLRLRVTVGAEFEESLDLVLDRTGSVVDGDLA